MDNKIENQGDQDNQDTAPHVDPATAANLQGIMDELGYEGEDENEQVATAVERDAEEARKAAQAQQARENGATMTAAMAVATAEKLVQLKWSYVTLPPDQKAQLVEAIRPVLLKYHAEMPAWLVPYQEELRAAVAVGGCVFSIWMQIQAHAQQVAEEALQKAQADSKEAAAAAGTAPAPTAPAAAKPATSSLIDMATRMDHA